MPAENLNGSTSLGSNTESQSQTSESPAGPSLRLTSKIPHILPHERIFPIQIGSEIFKLSGASISSDAPSYFSRFFLHRIKEAQDSRQDVTSAIHTLYIDRDPVTFKDISLHLQGYHVQPRDGTHFVRLFADAQFYSLPKLISQLYEESIFMSIGHRDFQIPRDVFSDPGNSPNFFSLGFAIFFSNPQELFPGLDREGLMRPPSILPPSVPNRSADSFAELLHMLRGYPIDVRSEAHRASLLRDCRYFNFKGIEQRLIPHTIAFNQARRRDEIVLRLEDILKSGISLVPERPAAPPAIHTEAGRFAAWVNYARPFVDTQPAELVLEVGGECTRLHFGSDHDGHDGPGARVELFREARTRLTKLFEVIASKLNLDQTTQPRGLLMTFGGAGSQSATPGNPPLRNDDLVKCALEPEASITLDGTSYTAHVALATEDDGWDNFADGADGAGGTSVGARGKPGLAPSCADPFVESTASRIGSLRNRPSKRRVLADGSIATGGVRGGQVPSRGFWIVRTGQWRLRIQSTSNDRRKGVECVLVAVKLDALSGEHARNEARGFLNDQKIRPV